jgi:hypothetical protein
MAVECPTDHGCGRHTYEAALAIVIIHEIAVRAGYPAPPNL